MRDESGAWPEHLDSGVGAVVTAKAGVRFRVWAPEYERVTLRRPAPGRSDVRMQPTERGYHEVVAEAAPGEHYLYALDGHEQALPDPASRSQPLGVHGASAVPDTCFDWTDAAWTGLPLHDYVIYELHIGTFTPEGTLDAAIGWLDELESVGITAIELMPLAQFPGTRNWGYDGVFPYSVQVSYGGPEALKRFVDACHARGLAVVLDVVYNHLGPEGNVLPRFGPYLSDRHRTPWGPAINFDGPWSDEVRRYFGGTARQWFVDFHVDALRLDAVHAIVDDSATPFLAELSAATDHLTETLGRPVYLIAESAANDPCVVAPRERNGLGMHAQWNDDFHHSLHALLTAERTGYYADYGQPDDLAKALRDGFVYDGAYSAYRRRRFGAKAGDAHPARMVVFARNHDQIGNRLYGERLTTMAGFEDLKLTAATLATAPGIPLLFMGEEYGEVAPFLYFVDHPDPGLVDAVRKGRKNEFAAFQWAGEPPDPADEATFERSKLEHSLRTTGDHARLRAFYTELLRLRRELPGLRTLQRDGIDVGLHSDVIVTTRRSDGQVAVVVLSFAHKSRTVPLPDGRWEVALDSSARRWGGSRTRGRSRVEGSFTVHGRSAVVLVGG